MITRLLLLVSVLLVSCTGEEYPGAPNYYVPHDDTIRLYVEFETTYKDFDVSLFDTQTNQYVYQGHDQKLYFEINAKYRGRYIFKFEQHQSVDEPYVRIHIKNLSDDKLIDDYEREGCTLGYNNSFIAW